MSNFGRVKTWGNEVLQPTDLNAEFDNIINNVTSGTVDADNIDLTDVYAWSGAHTHTSTLTVGVDDTGHDVQFFGATTGKSWLWDESADKMIVTGDASVSGTTTFTGVTTHGGNVVSDTDSTDDLGTTSVRWANLYVDDITVTTNVAATTFTGALAATSTIADGVTATTQSASDNSTKVATTAYADAAAAGGVTLTGSTNNTIATVTGADALAGEANLTFDGTTLAVTGDVTITDTAASLTIKASGTGGEQAELFLISDNAGDAGDGWQVLSQSNALAFKNDSAVSGTYVEKMRIDSSGNVGIGETSPLGKLHVRTADSGGSVHANVNELVVEGSGASGIQILSGTSAGGSIFFGDSGSNTQGQITYEHSANYMILATASTERMRIDSSGHITAPAQCAFLAEGASQLNATGDGTIYTVQYTTEIFDQNADFDGASTFTAPVTGRYQFNICWDIGGLLSTHTNINCQIVASNRTYTLISGHQNAAAVGTNFNYGSAILIDMDAADTVTTTIRVSNGTKVCDVSGNASQTLSGFLVA